MIPKFKAAMFDMDGTLLRTMRYWRLTTIELLLSYNIYPTPEQMARIFTSSSRALCMEAFAQHGIQKDQREVLRELESFMYRHYQKDATKKPRVEEYLETLRRQGIPMCIATAAPREFAREVLDRLGIGAYFDYITDRYEQGIGKENPEFFHRMAAHFGVDVSEMCVFEDALYSIRTAKSVGCPVIAIEDETQILDKAEIMRIADVYITDYAQLL